VKSANDVADVRNRDNRHDLRVYKTFWLILLWYVILHLCVFSQNQLSHLF